MASEVGVPDEWTLVETVELADDRVEDALARFVQHRPELADRPDCVRVDRVCGRDGFVELRLWTRDPAVSPASAPRTLP